MLVEFIDATLGHQTPLISKINASLKTGELHLLLGNNGIGKSTLINTFINPQQLISGEIFIEKEPLKSLTSKKIAEKIAFVFSQYQTPNDYTTKDLITLGKYIHYPFYFKISSNDSSKIDTIIYDLGLEKYKNTPLSHLSDGNLQKGFIGRAIAQDTPIMMLDEPCSHLDEENKNSILEILKNLCKQRNKTILFSSHDWKTSKKFADNIWFIKDKKLYSGLTEDILSNHAEFSDSIKKTEMPFIDAPEPFHSLLINLIEKNKINLSHLKFHYREKQWIATHLQETFQFKNFEEIKNFIQQFSQNPSNEN